MKAVNIYQGMNINVKIKEIQSLMDELNGLAAQSMTHSKILVQKYGKTIRHS